MDRKTTLKHLVNRINKDEEFLISHPDKKDLLEERIRRNKELIVQCVLRNQNNPHLEEISM